MANHRRSVEKEAYWRGHVERQSGSGVSIRKYCRENGVSEPSFYLWRRELRKRDLERGVDDRREHEGSSDVVPAGLVAVDVVASDSASTDRTAMLEIDVSGGVVIRLREDAAADTLERVLGVVCRHGVTSRGAAASAGGCEVGPC